MTDGPGYWLDPRTDTVFRVETTHDAWLLDPANRAKVGLTPKQGRVIDSLDPRSQIDEIRMVAVLAGLIRVRDRHRHLTIQFSASPSRLESALHAIEKALPRLFTGVEHYLLIHNLFDDAHAAIWTPEFARRLASGEAVLSARKRIAANDELRQRMDSLLS